MILALGLAVVVLGLVGMGIHVHLAVAAKSRDQVEEAQLARTLLQRIADDLRNAVPFQPPPSSSSSSALRRRPPAPARGRPAPRCFRLDRFLRHVGFRASTTPLSGGIYGTAQAIQIETARRPRATLASLQVAASDPSQPARLSDLRVVSYSLGAPITVDMSQNPPPSTSGTGLYRHEQDRAEFFYASQNGQIDQSDPATELLAPEVVDFQLTYYGGTSRHNEQRHGARPAAHRAMARSSSGTSNADTTTNGTTSDDPMGFDSTGHVARRREDFDFPPPRSAEIVARSSRHGEAAAGRVLVARQPAQCGCGRRKPGGPAGDTAAKVDAIRQHHTRKEEGVAELAEAWPGPTGKNGEGEGRGRGENGGRGGRGGGERRRSAAANDGGNGRAAVDQEAITVSTAGEARRGGEGGGGPARRQRRRRPWRRTAARRPRRKAAVESERQVMENSRPWKSLGQGNGARWPSSEAMAAAIPTRDGLWRTAHGVCLQLDRRRGVVLLLVLIVVTMLALGSLGFAELMLNEHRAAQTASRQSQARAFAESGAEVARQFLDRYPDDIQTAGGLYDNAAAIFQPARGRR